MEQPWPDPFNCRRLLFRPRKSKANRTTPLQLDHYINYARLYLVLEEAMRLYTHVFERGSVALLGLSRDMMSPSSSQTDPIHNQVVETSFKSFQASNVYRDLLKSVNKHIGKEGFKKHFGECIVGPLIFQRQEENKFKNIDRTSCSTCFLVLFGNCAIGNMGKSMYASRPTITLSDAWKIYDRPLFEEKTRLGYFYYGIATGYFALEANWPMLKMLFSGCWAEISITSKSTDHVATWTVEFWICLLLTILGYIPGIIYAIYISPDETQFLFTTASGGLTRVTR
ncbi:hypothetical protein SADUNF_Sadunf10G0168300 [Salix dunnii]|uniref:Uncharacterized protein n=1 Tax=Salix dunnii TaxID=1413687 RepID=A0A835JTJ5_9ROSI|nr:hypothetical protein SADUNF_Sadunf10G0168300 [Salix dunnii]